MSYKRRVVTNTDGSLSYVCAEGDMVDAIAFALYGEHGKNTSAIYALNRGLAEQGFRLAAGTVIKLPEASAPLETTQSVTLWD